MDTISRILKFSKMGVTHRSSSSGELEENGFGEKRGRVRWNRVSGRRMGERYGARVWKAEISQGFQKG